MEEARASSLHRPFLLPLWRPPPAPMSASSAPPALQPRRSLVGHLFNAVAVVVPCTAAPPPTDGSAHLCVSPHLYTAAPAIGCRHPRACTAAPPPTDGSAHLCVSPHLYTAAPAIGCRHPRACTEHTTGKVGDYGPTEEMKRGEAGIFGSGARFLL
jgi:hypothetical protein